MSQCALVHTPYFALQSIHLRLSHHKYKFMTIIAGVDEVGRGPLAGPVTAAAVILPKSHTIIGLTDSKKLSAKQRERLFIEISEQAMAIGIAHASHTEIDQINILQASLLAMKRAVEQLPIQPDELWVDGSHTIDTPYPCKAIIKGDLTVEAISAASIMAKVTRDRLMDDLHQHYPAYGFNQHAGYPTKAHIEVLNQIGPCEIHRQSFGPVKRSAQLINVLPSSTE